MYIKQPINVFTCVWNTTCKILIIYNVMCSSFVNSQDGHVSNDN